VAVGGAGRGQGGVRAGETLALLLIAEQGPGGRADTPPIVNAKPRGGEEGPRITHGSLIADNAAKQFARRRLRESDPGINNEADRDPRGPFCSCANAPWPPARRAHCGPRSRLI
jgi:hypothetical protein